MAIADSSRIDEGPKTPTSAYTRNSSGMVREVSTLNMMAFNASAASGTGMALVLSLFWVFAALPRADIYIALPAAYLVVGFVWVTFALLMAVFPRAGGDYLFGSRVIHPIVGLGSHIAVFVSTILAVAFFGAFVTTGALVPVFTIIGTTTHSPSWVHAAGTLSHRGWTFVIAAVSIAALSLLSMMRTKLITKMVTWSLAIATIGFLIAFFVVLFTSHASLVHAINSFSKPYTHIPNTYAATVAAGAKGGLLYPSQHGYSFSDTLGAFGIYIGLFILYFWGAYLAGEMKGGSRRSRQLTTMVAPGYVQGAIVIIAAFVFVHAVGYNFFAAATAGAYKVPVPPYYNFFSSIASGSAGLSVIMSLTFLGFMLPVLYINSSMVQRALFAWSFDGILPRKISSVSERTRTPVIAIAIVAILAIALAAWYIYSATLTVVLAISNVLLMAPVIVAGLAGILLPRRLPHLFENGPADWKVGGVRVLPIVSAGALIIGIVWGGLLMWFHSAYAIKSAIAMPLWLVGCFVVAAIWYFVAVAVQRSRGVELKYVYNSIPPE